MASKKLIIALYAMGTFGWIDIARVLLGGDPAGLLLPEGFYVLGGAAASIALAVECARKCLEVSRQ